MAQAQIAHNIKISFDPSEFNTKISNLESNGFREYLNTVDRGGDYDGYDHVIMTNTKKGHEFDGQVCDLYVGDGTAFLIYSKQY
jgi:hypothetical protein